MRLACFFALVLLVLPGCILSPGQDDLSTVCEVKSTSPSTPYTPDGIALFTKVNDGNLSAADQARIFAAIRPNVITLGGARHANFSANLNATSDGWRFEGIGRAENGTILDTYTYDITDEGRSISVQSLRPTADVIQPPESLVSAAYDIVNKTPDLDSARARTPTLVATGWARNIPSCVTLLFQDGPNDAIIPASPEHPHTKVVVSFSSHGVVFIKRDGWTV